MGITIVSGRRRIAVTLGALLALGTLGGPACAPYRSGLEDVLAQLARGDAIAALASLERRPRENDALYQLERGLLLREAKRFDESGAAFADADRIAEDLFTRSVSNEVASLAVSDRVRPYRPAPYERLLARFYQARNYIDRNDLEGALVEARRIEQLLNEQQDAAGGEVPAWIPLLYLTAGIIQEAGGRPEEALRLYRRLYDDARRRGADLDALPIGFRDGCEDLPVRQAWIRRTFRSLRPLRRWTPLRPSRPSCFSSGALSRPAEN